MPSNKDKNFNIPTRIAIDPTRIALDSKNEEIISSDIFIGQETLENRRHLRVFKDLKTVAREITPANGLFGKKKKPSEYPFEDCDLTSELNFAHSDFPVTMTVKELIVEFFKKLLQLDKSEFDIKSTTINKIVIGRPANNYIGEDGSPTKAEYSKTLIDCVANCFASEGKNAAQRMNAVQRIKQKIEVLPEPELAGVTYLHSKNNAASGEKNILVVDIGGGTADFTILNYRGDKADVKASASCEYAGNNIDKLIFSLLPDDFSVSKDMCRQAKEQLYMSKDGSGELGLYKSGERLILLEKQPLDNEYKNYISLWDGSLYLSGKLQKYADNADTLEQIFNKIAEKLKKMLKKWSGLNAGAKIDTVFYVGGTCSIKSLRDFLTAEVKKLFSDVNIVTPFDTKMKLSLNKDKDLPVTHYNAVAVGACIKAMGVALLELPTIDMEWKSFMTEYNISTENNRSLFLDTADYIVSAAIVDEDGAVFNHTKTSATDEPAEINWSVHYSGSKQDSKYTHTINLAKLSKEFDANKGYYGFLMLFSLDGRGQHWLTGYIFNTKNKEDAYTCLKTNGIEYMLSRFDNKQVHVFDVNGGDSYDMKFQARDTYNFFF